MVERITVSRDEVLRYPWIDHTWVYIYYPENSITKNPLFSNLCEMILKRGISEITGKVFENLTIEDGYVFIRYGTNDIIDILIKACTWILNRKLIHKYPTRPDGAFFTENRALFIAFFEETKKILEEKSYKYYYQCVDGMN